MSLFASWRVWLMAAVNTGTLACALTLPAPVRAQLASVKVPHLLEPAAAPEVGRQTRAAPGHPGLILNLSCPSAPGPLPSAVAAPAVNSDGEPKGWAGILIALFGGGLAGVAIDTVVAQRKQKADIALEIAKDYFTLYREFGKTNGMLISENVDDFLQQAEHDDRLRQIGDWLNYVASLLRAGRVEQRMLADIGLVDQIAAFQANINTARARTSRLDKAWSWWTYLNAPIAESGPWRRFWRTAVAPSASHRGPE